MNAICNECALQDYSVSLSVGGQMLCDKCIGAEDEKHMRKVNTVSMYVFKNHVSNLTKTFVLPANVCLGRSDLAPDKVEVMVVFDHSIWQGTTTAKVFPTMITLKRTKHREML
jgi:hypothetical protein